MITDGQVRKLWRLLATGQSLAASARMTGMDEKTARTYRENKVLPSQSQHARDYRTRKDPFHEVWSEVQARLETEPRLQAKTLLAWLQERYPGQFPDSTRRTFERRVRLWRSTYGPAKKVIFPQVHHPGRIAASDFTVMNSLNVRIAGSVFDHTLFHCVLTYSNVESVSLCFSESFESLSEGVQKAFWEFGGVPKLHRTDSLTAAVNNHSTKKVLTARYRALMDHYAVETQQTNARCPNENGDVESSNGHLKNVIDQALLLRSSRNFESREAYTQFVEEVVARRNHERRDRFAEEQEQLGELPPQKLDTNETLHSILVHSSSTILIRCNRYSVPSRLIGEKVDVTIRAEWIDVSHHGNHVQCMPRLIGSGGSAINYRHVIDSLVRKPGAFENYKYREDMFPTSHFRIAYDLLCNAHTEKVAVRKYLDILALAARESQDAVQDALRVQIQAGPVPGDPVIDVESVRESVLLATEVRPATDVTVEPPDLNDFDSLLEHPDMESPYDDNHYEEETTFASSNDESVSNKTGTSEAEGGTSEANHTTTLVRSDRTVSGVATADVSRPLSRDGGSSCDGGAESLGLPVGADNLGMRSSPSRSHPTIDDTFESSLEQDLGDVRLRSSSASSDTSVGESSGRDVLRSAGELVDLWQAGCGEESRSVCVGWGVDPAGSEHAVHNVQLVSSAVADSEAGLTSGEVHQAVVTVRRPVDRRLGLRATEPRGDGSVVYVIGRTLRTRECSSDEQSSVQQMGSDLQGRDDDCRSDRSSRSPQRDPRTECPQLSSGTSQAKQIPDEPKRNFLTRNSNCR